MNDNRVFQALDQLALSLVAITARAIAEHADGLDMTLVQWRVLVILGQRREAPRVGDVAADIGSSLPSTSRLLRHLERRGLVSTARDERDRRATLVSLTSEGAATRRRIIQARQRHIASALNSGSAMPSELVPGLQHIVQALAS